jgi:hypothetical protein
MGKDGKCHILERYGSSMAKFKLINTFLIFKRCYSRCIKLFIIGVVDAVFQLLLGKVCKEKLHPLIGYPLVGIAA